MWQDGAAAPPTTGVAKQDPPIVFPSGELGVVSGAAAAGGGVRRVPCQKQGEGETTV